MNKLFVTSSPHIKQTDTTRGIMLDVLIALFPIAVCGIYFFGFHAALLIAVCVTSAVISEYFWCKAVKKQPSLSDLSAIVTGLLLAFNLPPELPLWMGALGSAVAIVVVKQMFGGLGQNFANPAITARIVLMVSFPAAMTNYTAPFTDAVSTATPLKEGVVTSVPQLLLGTHAGCLGETASLLLIAGGLYLVLRKVIAPTIPLAFILSAAVLAFVLGEDPLRTVLSGGLLIGAIFMATDYTTSPPNFWGRIIFGVGCGVITVTIRHFGNLPEGVSFSILLMNILVPHIVKLTAPRPFGWEGHKNEN